MEESTTIEFWCAYGGKHPVIGHVWHRMSTAHGFEEDRYARYICAALAMMAHTVTDCEEMLGRLDAVIAGTSQREEYGLNDTCVVFRPQFAQVEILIEDEEEPVAGRFGLSEYHTALCAWRDFLSMPESEESRMRFELP
jgi:hypothetical protein